VNVARPRIVRRAVHGVLLLDKPLGLSSNDALQLAKRLYRAEKAGHTGTLDPLATGLLPLCFGAATKFSQVCLDADKTYRATLILGLTTTTADAEGEVLLERPVTSSDDEIAAACAAFTGAIDQVPPMHSALKHQGQPLYKYARAGIEIEREARRVTIHRIGIVWRDGDRLTIDVACSKGTYVRTLAEDIGERLGCGAHLGALRRLQSGVLSIDHAVTLAELEAMSEAERDAALLKPDAPVEHWPAITLGSEDAGRFLSGVRRRLSLADAPNVRVYGPEPGAFLGGGKVVGGELISTRLLSPVEVGDLTGHRAAAAEAPTPAAAPASGANLPRPTAQNMQMSPALSALPAATDQPRTTP
jgi:tRNA pseudouridine55 synthase